MREIKFKAWHKSDKKMYDVYGFSTSKWFLKGKRFPMPSGAIYLMQYTGLKDKNGKEIYEGDILKVSTASSERGYWEVYFEMGSYDAKRIHDGYIEDLVDVVIDCEGVNQCEVIGNIHENPELLEGDNQ